MVYTFYGLNCCILLTIKYLNIFYYQKWVYSVNHKYDRLNLNS